MTPSSPASDPNVDAISDREFVPNTGNVEDTDDNKIETQNLQPEIIFESKEVVQPLSDQ